MRGGVSLAVWIGGAFAEIDRLRRADTVSDQFVGRLLATTRFGSVEIDILTGASAGGLNAALGGLAIARDQPTNLRETWLETADIDRLLNSKVGVHPNRRRSLLNGDYFLKAVKDRLSELAVKTTDHTNPVEMFLAATVFGGVPVTERSDPSFSDRRSEAYFHFRHLANDRAFSDLLDPEVADRLGHAARATASFPGAFEPVELKTESYRGQLHLPQSPSPPKVVRLYDGGVVDNIPVSRAIRAAGIAPATETVRRWVVFLHPSPTLDSRRPRQKDRSRRPSILSVVWDLRVGQGVETLLDDLEILRAHNRDAQLYRTERYSLVRTALARSEIDNPADALASVDAYWLYSLLEDPQEVLPWVPVGEATPDSPLKGLHDDRLFAERMTIHMAVLSRDKVIRPFARIARLAFLTIDWIQSIEATERAHKLGKERRQVYDILLVAQLLDAALARVFLAASPGAGVTALERHLDAVERSECLLGLVESLPRQGEVVGRDVALIERLADGPQRALIALACGELPGVGDWKITPASVPESGGRSTSSALMEQLVKVCLALHRVGTLRRNQEDLSVGRERSDIHTTNSSSPQQPRPPHPDTHFFTVLTRHLGDEPAPEKVERSLLTVDVALAGLHRGRTTVTPRPLEYVRISGASGTPLADRDFAAEVLPKFTHLTLNADGLMDPRSKLAGNQLGNFSAFLSRRFRANDWMWGRMDAAAGLVHVLLRPEHLEPNISLEQRCLHFKELVTEPITATDNAMTAYAKSATRLCAELWARYEESVRVELGAAAVAIERRRSFAPDDLKCVQKLVTTRWHLELLVNEAGEVIAQPLQPRDGPGSLPEAPYEVTETGPVGPAVANIRHLLHSYESTERHFSDLWGRRQTTALGVRAAVLAARALARPTGIAGAAAKVALAVPFILIAYAALLRGAFLVAFAVYTNVIVAPRLHGLNRLVFLLAAGASVAYWLVCVKRQKGTKGVGSGWLAAAFVLVAFGLGASTMFWNVPPISPPKPDATGKIADGDLRAHGLAVGAAVAVVVGCTLLWAKRVLAVCLTVLSAAFMGLWASLRVRQGGDEGGSLAREAFGSMWVPVIVIAAAVTCLLLWWHAEKRPPAGAPNRNRWRRRGFVNWAHQGGALEEPSNTLYAMQAAWDRRAFLELEVHRTADDRLVVCHDKTLDRTTNKKGRISRRTLAQIREADSAYWWKRGVVADHGGAGTYPYRGKGPTEADFRVPTLSEVLDRFPDAPVIIELKARGIDRLVAAELTDRNRTDVIVASCSGRRLKRYRKRVPGAETSAGTLFVLSFWLLSFVRVVRRPPAGVVAFQIPGVLATKSLIRAAKQRDVAIHVRTINKPARMRRLIGKGVDGIMTDRPSALSDALAEAGVPQAGTEAASQGPPGDLRTPRRGGGGPAELRIHGVGGAPGPRLLGFESPEQTQSRRNGPITVRWRRNANPGAVLGFEWGDLTSGARSQALWIFLLPFTLLNVAGWAVSDRASRLRTVLTKVNVVVLGWVLTATSALWVSHLLVGYAGYQWVPAATGGRQQSVPLVPWDWKLSPTALRALGVGAGAAIAVGLLVAVEILTRRSKEAVEEPKGPNAPRPDDDHTFGPTFFAKRPSWAASRVTHLVIGGAAIALVTTQAIIALGHSQPPATTTSDVSLLLAMGLEVLLLALLAIGSWLLPWLLSVVWPSRAYGERRPSGCTVAAAGLAVGLTNAFFSGVVLWTVKYLGSRPKSISRQLTVGRELALVDTYAYVALVIGLIGLLLFLCRNRIGQQARECPGETIPDDWRKRVQTAQGTAKLAHRADLGALACALILLGLTIGIGWTRIDAGWRAPWHWSLAPPVAKGAAYAISAWALPGLVVLVALRVRAAARDTRVRRFLGQAWDVLTFWPRRFHPFAVRPYSHVAVPALRNEILDLAAMGPLVVSAHSQGSALAAAALAPLTNEQLARVGFVTYGSHLGQLYRRAFPAWFNRDQVSSLIDKFGGVEDLRWYNFYRHTDPIGGPLLEPFDERHDHCLPDPAQPAGSPDRRFDDPPLERDREPWADLAVHSDYLRERALKDCVQGLKSELEGPPVRRQ